MDGGERQVRNIIAKVRDLVGQRNLGKAVELYAGLDEKYHALDAKRQDAIRPEIDVVYKELVGYLRVNEAYIFAERGDLARLKAELKSMHELVFDLSSEELTPDLSVLLDYLQRHSLFFLDVYDYKMNINDFNRKYEGVMEALGQKDIHLALKRYSELFLAYNNLTGYLSPSKKVELYSKIRSLFKEISVQRLFALASEHPKKVKVEFKFPKVKPVLLQRNLPEAMRFDERFARVHDLLVKDKDGRALRLYENIDPLAGVRHGDVAPKEKGLRFVKVKAGVSRHNLQTGMAFDARFGKVKKLLSRNKVKRAKRLYRRL